MGVDFNKFAEMVRKTAGEQEPSNRRHIAIIGPSGSGKTTWASKAEDCLVILAEAQAYGRIQDSAPKARVVTVQNAEELRQCFDWLNTKVFPGKGWKPKTIVLDSTTEMCRMIADRVGPADEGDWTFKHWKRYDDACMAMVRKFRDLPCQLIATFLDETSGSDDGMTYRRMAVGKRSMAPKIAALFDLVMWLDVRDKGEENVTHAIRTTGGTFRGFVLEHGKGHPALSKWLEASDHPPIKVNEIISGYVKSQARKG
tara:strand:- start:92 stop:859 length:768 start_codon:yes stop_codon:yes gene_type:complete